MMRWKLAFGGDMPVPLVVGLGVAAVLLALVFYTRKRSSVRPLSWWALMALRALVIIVLCFFLMQPYISCTYIETHRTTVAVMVDASGSMRVPDAAGSQTRLNAANALVSGGSADLVRRLDRTHNVRLYSFGAVVTPLADTDEAAALKPEQRATALAAALQAAVDDSGGDELSGIVLLTDGVVTAGDHPEDVAAGHPEVPIFPVALGGEGPFPDVGIVGIPDLPRFVVNNEATIKVDLLGTGLAGIDAQARALDLTLRDGEQVAAAQQVEFPAADSRREAELTVVPRRAGTMRLTVGLAALPDELVTENNTRTLTVRVTDPRMRVLIVEGKPRQENRFLRNVLESDPNIELTGVVKLTGRDFLIQGENPGMDLGAGLPATQQDFEKFDVVILGDIGSEEFTSAQLADLRAWVDAGGGLMVTGGYNAFGAGNYQETPLAEVLPVTMGGPRDGHVEEPFVPRLTDVGRDHLVFRGCEEFFTGVDAPGKLDGANRVAGLKRNAEALAVHPAEQAGGGPLPVAAVHRYGGGRVMAFTGDTTWKWKFGMATQGLDSPYYRFWRQSVRWLAATEEDETDKEASELVTAWTPHFANEPDQHVVLKARVKDAGGDPVSDAAVQAFITFPVPVERMGTTGMEQVVSASVPLLPVAASPGDYEAAWLPPVRGLYQATARVKHQGRDLGAAPFEFATGLAVSAWTTRGQYEAGDSVVVRARVRGRENEAVPDENVTAYVEYPFPLTRKSATGKDITESSTSLTLTALADVPGEYQVTWQPPVPGLYRATVHAGGEDESAGSYLLEFVVGRSDPEFHSLDVDHAGLRALARVSSGRWHTQATASSIPDELAGRRRSEFRTETFSLWNAPWFFVFLLAAATSEWILRKRRALN